MATRPSHQTPNLALALEGSNGISLPLDFSAGAPIMVDVTSEMMDSKTKFIQSIYIDNADNAAPLDLTFYGAPIPQRIRAQAFSQGWYPISWPVGNGLIKANTTTGQVINVILANFAMPYLVWGPAAGVTVTPNLVNPALDQAIGAGSDTQLVAGIGGESVKLYRGIFSVDQPTILTFTSGVAGTLLFAAQLTAGGSLTFQASGIPWFAALNGADLTLHSSAACNLFGGFGYVQS